MAVISAAVRAYHWLINRCETNIGILCLMRNRRSPSWWKARSCAASVSLSAASTAEKYLAALPRLPSPLWGGVGVGSGGNAKTSTLAPHFPTPTPPHKGEGKESMRARDAEIHRLGERGLHRRIGKQRQR